jgi:hypothetical protein
MKHTTVEGSSNPTSIFTYNPPCCFLTHDASYAVESNFCTIWKTGNQTAELRNICRWQLVSEKIGATDKYKQF